MYVQVSDASGKQYPFLTRYDTRGMAADTNPRFEASPDLCSINALTREHAQPNVSALRLAARHGCATLVPTLLETPQTEPAVDVDIRDANGRVALHDVARSPFNSMTAHTFRLAHQVASAKEEASDDRNAMSR
jgi:hypothetical protein